MSKVGWSVVGIVGIIVVVIYIASSFFMRSTPTTSLGAVDLTNLPDHYCPTTAALVVSDINPANQSILFDRAVPVVACRQIQLGHVTGLNQSPRPNGTWFDQRNDCSISCSDPGLTPQGLSKQLNQTRFVYIKLPNALAFRLQVDSASGQYSFAPSLGDLNGDNIIDTIDEQSVISSLLATDNILIQKNDLDQDGKVTVLDLALTRVNRQNGVDRPDSQKWSIE